MMAKLEATLSDTNERVEILAFVPFATQSIPRQVAAVYIDPLGRLRWENIGQFKDARSLPAPHNMEKGE